MALKPMKVSAVGRKDLEEDEGVRLKAYLDCVQIWTIGTGHTAKAGLPYPCAGMVITAAENDSILARDLGAVETGVMKLLKRQPTQPQFDAMCRCTYNIGLGGFGRSQILARFNRGDDEGAAISFLAWDRAGGRENSSLLARRKREMAMFKSGIPAKVTYGVVGDTEDMPSEVDVPEQPKTMVSSKTGWASIATGASGITGVVAAAKPVLDGAQGIKDTAGQASGLIGVDGNPAILIGLAMVIVIGCVFIWFDRWKKLVQDGV